MELIIMCSLFNIKFSICKAFSDQCLDALNIFKQREWKLSLTKLRRLQCLVLAKNDEDYPKNYYVALLENDRYGKIILLPRDDEYDSTIGRMLKAEIVDLNASDEDLKAKFEVWINNRKLKANKFYDGWNFDEFINSNCKKNYIMPMLRIIDPISSEGKKLLDSNYSDETVQWATNRITYDEAKKIGRAHV